MSQPACVLPCLRPIAAWSAARDESVLFTDNFLVDARTGVVLCPIKPLDKAANANGQRRRLDPVGRDLSPLPPTGLAPLLRELLAEYAATGMPPAYLPAAEPTPAVTPINPPEAHPT